MCFYFFIFQPFEEHEIGKIGDVVAGSVICSNGNLTPNFEYIAKLRAENEASAAPKGDFSTEKKASTLAIIRTYISTLSTLCIITGFGFGCRICFSPSCRIPHKRSKHWSYCGSRFKWSSQERGIKVRKTVTHMMKILALFLDLQWIFIISDLKGLNLFYLMSTKAQSVWMISLILTILSFLSYLGQCIQLLPKGKETHEHYSIKTWWILKILILEANTSE